MAKRLRRFKFSNLPKLSREQSRLLNTLLTHFPQTPFERGFKERLRNVLEPLLHADIDIWFDSVVTVEAGAITTMVSTPCCAALIGLLPKPQKALLEMDLGLAQQCIDRLLGGSADDVDPNRPLSEIEEGVFSFILLRVLGVVHEVFAAERQVALKLEGLVGTHEVLRQRASVDERMVVMSFKLFLDNRVGVMRLYLPASLIDSEFPASQPPPGPARDRMLLAMKDRVGLVRLLRTPLIVEVGRISLAMADIEALETEDIILVEESDAQITPGDDDTPAKLSGTVQARVGDGAHGVLIGSLMVGENGRYEVGIDSIVPEGEPRAMGFLFRGSPGGAAMAEESQRLSAPKVGGLDGEALRAWAAAPLRAVPPLSGRAGRTIAERTAASGANKVDAAAEHSHSDDDEPPASEAAQLLDDVTVAMVVELGRVMVSAADVMGLRPGQVVELSRSPGEPVDLVVDGKRIGKGELVEIDGELGVRILSLAR